MLINIEHVDKSYGERQLLTDVTLYLNPGDRLGVVGVNGSGKSTLLKVAAGAEEPDSGRVSRDPNVCVAYLPQDPPYDPDYSLLRYVLEDRPANEREYAEYEAKEILTRLGLPGTEQRMGELSGGQRKRAALAKCLLTPADVLILDEPTNHLDLAMILWLEEYLEGFAGAILFVSHDRYFLEQVARRTAEVSFGRLFLYEGGYSAWLDGKARREEMEAASERKRRSILRRELIWVLQGPCARGTKSRERLERYEALKAQLPPQTDGEMEKVELIASRLGKKTIELQGAGKRWGESLVVPPLDLMLLRDDRLGIIGLNGSGKSTLLNLIAGVFPPDFGSVERGETVKIGYFSQHAAEMDGSMTAIEYVKERGERIETKEGYMTAGRLMEMFLFSGDLQHRQISRLSGGEKRRLFLLGILAEAPNVLLLDEPTNDLDIPTLNVLEDYLRTFPGAVVAVSHDRYFLDRVCRRVLVTERGRPARMFNGGYTDYMALAAAEQREIAPKEKEEPRRERSSQPKKLKFSFKEQREYETIDDVIAELEEKIADCEAQEALCGSDYVKLQEVLAEKEHLEALLEEKTERWLYLTELAEKIEAQKKG